MNKKIIASLAILLVFSMVLTSVSASSSTFGITATVIGTNSYLVAYYDNSSLAATVNVLSGNALTSSFSITSSGHTTINITENTTVEIFYNGTNVASVFLRYTLPVPTLTVVSSPLENVVTVTVPILNTYSLVVTNNGTIIVSITLMQTVSNFTFPHYSTPLYLNLTSNGKLVISKVVQPFSQYVKLDYTFANNSYHFTMFAYNYSGYQFNISFNGTRYLAGGIFVSSFYYNFTVPYGSYGLGEGTVPAMIFLYTNQISTTKTFQIAKEQAVSTSDFSLSVTPLANNSYLLTYKTPLPASIYVFTTANVQIQDSLVNGSGMMFVSSSANPGYAVLKWDNQTESYQVFAPTNTTHTRIIYEYVGMSTVEVVELLAGVVAIMFGMFAVLAKGLFMVRIKRHTNKDSSIHDRLDTSAASTIEYASEKENAERAKWYDKLMKFHDEDEQLRQRVEKLEKKLSEQPRSIV